MIGVASRSEVARWTGLSRSTVSSIVSELQLEGVVIDRDGDTRPATGGGRPPALIALDPRVGLAVGIDFGKRHLAVAIADLSHDVLAEEWREMREDYEAEEGIRFASDLVDSVLEQAEADRERILGVGMGLPSPIHRTGLVGSSAILPGWSGTRGGDRMAERLGLPVRVRNDADLGALAEDVEVVLGELGERAELLGAVALVLHEAGPAWNGRSPAQGKTAEVTT